MTSTEPMPSTLRPPGTPSDEEVVARVRAGDTAAFELLMRRHNPRVYRVVRSVIADEAEAEDVMQQAYLHAYSALGGFEGASSFATWLTRIALNEALGRRRKRRWLEPVAELPEGLEAFMESPRTPEDVAASREQVRLMERAIDRLPAIHRTVIMLREVEQLSTAEAAAVLQISEEAVKVRLHRARAALLGSLAEQARGSAHEAFSFRAPRCDRVVEAVMSRLGGDAA